MAQLRFPEARAGFRSAQPATELTRLGEALSLLGAQPRTDANINAAERLIATLAAEAADPDLRARAAYLHARVPHLHRQPSDWAEASRRYLAAHQAHPAHPLGQRAYVRHGVVTLFRPMSPDELSAAIGRFIEGASAIDDPVALRDFEWLLASLHERRTADRAATLAHLERLLASPVPLREINRLGLLVQAGELARETGDRAAAARHYREFLAGNPRDSRVHLIRERLTEVEGAR
jgi:hypothetical protein